MTTVLQILKFLASSSWGDLAKIFLACLLVGSVAALIVLAKIKEPSKPLSWFTGLFKRKSKKTKCPYFKAHPVFQSMREYTSHLATLDILDPGRKLVFQDLLTCHVMALRNGLDALVSKPVMSDLTALSDMELANLFAKTINDCEMDWISRWKLQGIPEPVITVYNKWLTENQVIDRLRWASNQAAYNGFMDHTAKVSSFLTAVSGSLLHIQFTGWKTFQNVNGTLTGVVYKGITVGSNHNTSRIKH